jgi:hypothetical protein
MKRERFSVEQMVAVLKQAEAGMPVAGLIRHAGISEQTFLSLEEGIRLPDGDIGHRTFRVDQRGNFEAKSGKFPADSLRHALRRERRAENRSNDGFSVVSLVCQGQITASTTK